GTGSHSRHAGHVGFCSTFTGHFEQGKPAMTVKRMMPLFLLLLAGLGWSQGAWADPPGIPAFQVTTNPDGTEEYSVTLQILGLMTALTFIPAFLMMATCFTRIIIVFSILRQAIGLQQAPSNQILIGI